MALTGSEGGPALIAPDAVVDRIRNLGAPLGVDPLPLLAERATIARLSRHGRTSCGGSTRLLRAADGWIAASLTRPDDVALIPAWLGVDEQDVGVDPWAIVAAVVQRRSSAETIEAGAVLGLGVALLGETRRNRQATQATRFGDATPGAEPLVVDLSSLWAGPLCARLLGEWGARVVKVESLTRPDGARAGPAAFFDLMHHGQRSVALDFTDHAGVARLRRLLAAADVVIEGSRPRALEQLGIDAVAMLADGPAIWVSITGHGREGSVGNRVAFGDDGAVAGGLVARHDGQPWFVADAVADPLAGVAAAAAAVTHLERGGRWLVDVAMARVAASVAEDCTDEWGAGDDGSAATPVAPSPPGPGPALGEHTGEVFAELGG